LFLLWKSPKARRPKRGVDPRKKRSYGVFKYRCLPKIIGKLNGELTAERRTEVELSPFFCYLDININEESI
jgi:hypothetical protein